jgi:hypothetical protein
MTVIASIQATYANYSDDGTYIINGTESVASAGPAVPPTITFHEYLKLSGRDTGTRITSEPGGFVLYPTVLENTYHGDATRRADDVGDVAPGQCSRPVPCWARIQDRCGDPLLLAAAWGCQAAIVDESTEDLFSADPLLGEVDFRWPGVSLSRCELAERTVRSCRVVVQQVFGQHLAQVVFVDDQQPVEELAAQGADDPFADGVAPHRQLHPIRRIGIVASG